MSRLEVDESTMVAFWGKASPDAEIARPSHAAAYHLLDVAASADALLRSRPRLLARGARLFSTSPDEALALTVVLAALHDLGKFAWRFQAKVPALYPTALAPFRPPPVGASHAADGLMLWQKRLGDTLAPRIWPAGMRALDRLSHAVFGHHGRPVRPSDGAIVDVFHPIGLDAAVACASRMVGLWMPTPLDAGSLGGTAAARASWWLAGVITLADWVGSQQQFFRYEGTAHTLADYKEIATERAARAVRACGLDAPRAAASRSFSEVTGILGSPTPAQQWAGEVQLPDGPVLVLVEDVTGAGKTEAAQVLVHRLMAEERASGAYWAMPTQATANAMYERQRAMLDGLFDGHGPRPSLVLAHGQARLSDRFRDTVLRLDASADAQSAGNVSDGEPPSDASCAAFLADDRRAALLADVGAGTIDQALLAALPSKFNALRLAGLADKVLVVDEAHAYDEYMSEELVALLRFQAALGGCAIVLSATLSRAQWEKLVRAWSDGLGMGAASRALPERVPSYPLATVVGGVEPSAIVTQVPLDAAERSKRRVEVRMLRSIDEVLERIVAAQQAGGAVAWIRNTVNECIDGATRLREAGVEPIVFHARFAQGDRQRREREVLELFGRPDPTAPYREEARRGRVLVATQVVEQSLDLDFDVMISDLAPIDLLIQRAGRLWRHPARDGWRRANGFERTFFVLSAEAPEAPAASWPGPVLPKMKHVYPHVGVLWRTARVLERAGAVVTPGAEGDPAGLRSLIAAVYDANDEDLPATLRPMANDAAGAQGAMAAAGRYVALNVADGYDAFGGGWVDDITAVTRLGAESTTVRLARVAESGALHPWETNEVLPEWQRWALSEIRIAPYKVPSDAKADGAHARAVEAVRARWGRWEQSIPVLPLQPMPAGLWAGRLFTAEGVEVPLRLCPLHGLTFPDD